MRILRLLSTVMFILCATSLFAQQNWKESTEEYKGNTYNIRNGGSVYSVTNQKYDFPTGTTSPVGPLEGESLGQYWQRVREGLYNDISKLKLSVFTPEEVKKIKEAGGIGISTSCYWDTRTGNYVGIRFLIPTRLADIVTIAKIYEIEQKLLNAHLNAGKQNLKEPDKRYFRL